MARESQSEPTNSGLGVRDDYHHWSPWSWGWVRGSGKPGVVRPRDRTSPLHLAHLTNAPSDKLSRNAAHLCIFNYCLAGAPSVLQFYSHRLIASFSTAPHGLLDEQLLASPTPVPTPRTTAKDGDSRREPEGRYWSALIDLRGPPGSFRSSHHVEVGIVVPEMA